MEVLEKAKSMLMDKPLCDHCLGRQFALLLHGLSNEERGRCIKLALALDAHQRLQKGDPEAANLLRALATNGFLEAAKSVLRERGEGVEGSGQCYLCEGIFEQLDELAEQAVEKLSGYEFEAFLVGIKLPPHVVEREDEFRSKHGVEWGEGLRNQLSREIGKRISSLVKKRVDHKKPDIVVLINPYEKEVSLQVNPIFIAGRYRKLVRGIPQAKWICTKCRGRGCERCGWKGKLYDESIEELVGTPILKKAMGVSIKFHAAGREDIDARMLGSGRPFVVEVREPRVRSLNLRELEEEINREAQGKVEVVGLRFSSRAEVKKLKAMGDAPKTYRALVRFGRDVSEEELRRVEEALSGAKVKQQTPTRVLHRRADLVREKSIYEVQIKKVSSNTAELIVRCQGGLYVKELVDGDEGRTKPSVSEMLGTTASCLELDVLEVGGEGGG